MQVEQPTNCFARDLWSKGDVEQGFAGSDVIVENTFSVPRQHQAYLETHSCLVWIDDEGRVQIWASSKVPYLVKQQLANALGLPEERIRINPVNIGGGLWRQGFPDEHSPGLLPGRENRPAGKDGDGLHRGIHGRQSPAQRSG